MCFSPEVSLGSACLLGCIGVASLKSVKERAQIPFATLPLFFAAHQLSEGILWIYLESGLSPNALFFSAQWFYLFIAHLLLVVLLPFSVWFMESVPWRKRIIGVMLLSAVVLAFYNISRLPSNEVVVHVVGHSIQYPFTHPVLAAWHMLLVTVPFTLSSRRHVWWLGAMGILGIGLAYALFWWTFTSVWCFIAACISAAIFLILNTSNAKSEVTFGRD